MVHKNNLQKNSKLKDKQKGTKKSKIFEAILALIINYLLYYICLDPWIDRSYLLLMLLFPAILQFVLL